MIVTSSTKVVEELVDGLSLGASIVFAKRTMSEEEKTKRWGPVAGRFRSSSTPGKYYEVRKKGPGQYSCNCPGWVYHRHCKHIDSVQHGVKSE